MPCGPTHGTSKYMFHMGSFVITMEQGQGQGPVGSAPKNTYRYRTKVYHPPIKSYVLKSYNFKVVQGFGRTFSVRHLKQMGGGGCRMGGVVGAEWGGCKKNHQEMAANLAPTSQSSCEPREATANLAKWLRTSRSGSEPREAAGTLGGPHRRCVRL